MTDKKKKISYKTYHAYFTFDLSHSLAKLESCKKDSTCVNQLNVTVCFTYSLRMCWCFYFYFMNSLWTVMWICFSKLIVYGNLYNGITIRIKIIQTWLQVKLDVQYEDAVFLTLGQDNIRGRKAPMIQQNETLALCCELFQYEGNGLKKLCRQESTNLARDCTKRELEETCWDYGKGYQWTYI